MLQFPTYPLSLIAMYYSLGTDGKDESSITFQLKPYYKETSMEKLEELIKKSFYTTISIEKEDYDPETEEYHFRVKEVDK